MILRSNKSTIRLNEAGESVTIPKVEAIFRSLEFAALKGNVRAMCRYLDVSLESEREEAAERSAALRAVGEYKIKCEHERRRCARLGIEPSFLIDPDSFIVSAEGIIIGHRDAATEEETARWEEQRAEWQEQLEGVEAQLESARGRKRTRLQEEIARFELALGIVEDALAGSRHAMWILDQGTVPDEDD